MNPLPRFYTSLDDFEAVFETGLPILTYHKLGPRPSGVRMKGLYVDPRLFHRQLGELRAVGWETVLPDGAPFAAALVSRPDRRIAITFDDGFENVLKHGLAPLAQHGFRAIQFLVADLIGRENAWEQQLLGEAPERLMDASQIREWLAAGHEIGGHTCTHPQLTRLTLAQAREEIGACRRKLEDLFGRPVRHFCYPYGDWNPAVRDLVAEAGYETACTVDAGVNRPGDDPFGLKRYPARYRSRNWGAVRRWFRKRFQPRKSG